MNKFSFKKTFVYFGIFLIIFLADRISKIYILSVLENSGEVDIYINSYISLILVWNSGIGLGLLSIDKSANFANKSAAHVISEIGVRPKRKFN